MDQNPVSKSVLGGSILLVLTDNENLSDWSLVGDKDLVLSRPFVFGDIDGIDRADLIESMDLLGEDPEYVRGYLRVVDAVVDEVELEDGYFEKTAHNMGCDSQGMTLALQIDGRIGKWLKKFTIEKSVVVGDYTLFEDGRVVVRIDSPYEPMLKACKS